MFFMFKYSSQYKNRAFLLSLFIYVILLLLFTYKVTVDDKKSLNISEKRVSLKFCEQKKELKKSAPKKVKQNVEKKTIKKKIIKQKVKEKIIKKTVPILKSKPKVIEKEIIKEKVVKKLVEEPTTEPKKVEEVEVAEKPNVLIVQEKSASKELVGSIERALRKHIYYPKAARRMGLEATVKLKFKYLPNKDLTNVKISGDAPTILLRAAKKTLNRASSDFEKVKNAVTIEVPLKFILEK